jgi:hypothetical protein
MVNFRYLEFRRFLLAAIAMLCAALPTESRTWSHNPIALAQDYLFIIDNRANRETVMIFWLAPALVPNPSSLFKKYVIIGVAHFTGSSDGMFNFEQVATPVAEDGNGQPLNYVDEDAQPPSVVGALAAVQSVFTRGLGAIGKGVHWFAFDSGAVNACEKGALFVEFAGEKYSYITPIPGCAPSSPTSP